ncbi:hypothetical protein ABZ371_25180, partial [Streptomyces sp. NPDC005899]
MSDARTGADRLALGTPLHEALDTASPTAWAALDAGVRILASRPGNPLPTRHELRALPAGPPSPADASRIALALCHPNGRLREAALDRVAGARALRPLLVVRCADWVAPVRDRARALLAELPASQLAALAPLVLLLSRRERGGFALRLLEGALRDGPGRIVRALLTHEDRAV